MTRNLNSQPLISVVLPTHNRSDLLRRAVQSVLKQSLPDLELIVVDDASTEDIEAACDAFNDDRLRYIRRNECGGPGAARNTGVSAATGQYIAFQDSDDEWLTDKLEQQLSFLQQHPEVVLVSCGLVRHCPTHLAEFPPAVLLNEPPQETMRRFLLTFTQTWLVRTDVVHAAGGFDGRLKIWDDWDLLMRISQQGTIAYMSSKLVVSYILEGGVGRDVTRRIHDLQQFVHMYADADRVFQSRLHYLLGRFRLLNDEYGEARRDFVRALRLRKRNLRAWLLLMLSLTGKGIVRRVVA